MEGRTFRIVTSISLVLTVTVAILSIIGITITGLYPGIVVLSMVTLVPVASKMYARMILKKPDGVRKSHYTIFTLINSLSILVVLWMTFVILHDRVLQDCC